MDNKIAQELSEILPQINIRGSVFSREYLIYSFGENTNWNASEVSIIINFLFNLYGRYPWIKEETEEEKAEREAKWKQYLIDKKAGKNPVLEKDRKPIPQSTSPLTVDYRYEHKDGSLIKIWVKFSI
jgi:hypothetical protein